MNKVIEILTNFASLSQFNCKISSASVIWFYEFLLILENF